LILFHPHVGWSFDAKHPGQQIIKITEHKTANNRRNSIERNIASVANVLPIADGKSSVLF
jgi:hypothetical protein